MRQVDRWAPDGWYLVFYDFRHEFEPVGRSSLISVISCMGQAQRRSDGTPIFLDPRDARRAGQRVLAGPGRAQPGESTRAVRRSLKVWPTSARIGRAVARRARRVGGVQGVASVHRDDPDQSRRAASAPIWPDPPLLRVGARSGDRPRPRWEQAPRQGQALEPGGARASSKRAGADGGRWEPGGSSGVCHRDQLGSKLGQPPPRSQVILPPAQPTPMMAGLMPRDVLNIDADQHLRQHPNRTARRPP